jgi:WD40 repeat protein
MPLWVPIAGALGVFVLGVVGILVAYVVTLERNKNAPTTDAVAKGTTPGATVVKDTQRTDDRPVKARDADAGKDPDRRDPSDKLQPVVVPPLPPEGQRPTLVLDAGGHNSTVKASLFTPDGSRLVTVSLDKTVRVWDAQTGVTLHTFRMPVGPGGEGALTVAAISPDGKRLAVSGTPVGLGKHGIPIYLLSLETGELERVIKGHGSGVTALAFSPDGKWLASGSLDKTAIVWRTDTGAAAGTMAGHTERLSAIAFHPTDGSIATAAHDKTVRIWAPKANRFEPIICRADAVLLSLTWRPDGERVAAGGFDGNVWMFTREGQSAGIHGPILDKDPRNGNPGTLQLVGLQFTADGEGLLYGGVCFLGRAGIWDIAARKPKLEFTKHSNTVQAVGLSKDGTLAFTTGGDDHESCVWRVADGEVVHKIVAAGRSVWAVGWSGDSKSLLFGHTNLERGLGIRPLERCFNLDRFEFTKVPQRDVIQAQAKLGDYELRRVGLEEIEVLRDGRKHFTLTSGGDRDRVYSATLLTDERALIGTGVGRVILFDLKEKKVLREFTGHPGIVLTLAPSPDNQFFATGSTDQTVAIWRFDRLEPIMTFFPAGREWIAWTPEGYYSASASGERLMGWQVSNGPDRLGVYYPAIRFRQSLFQPEVVRNLFRASGKLPDAIALAVKEKRKPIGTVNVTQVLPPEVAITSPKPVNGEAKVDKANLQVSATAKSTGNHAVRSMRLLVDGRPYGGDQGVKVFAPARPGAVEASWEIALPPGQHSIAVLADSGVSKGMSTPVTVVRDAKTRLPNLYIFAVGVSAYPGRLRLNFAANDARNFARVLKEKTNGVFGNVEVRLLTDREGSRDAILAGLDWMKTKMTWEDVGVFFFSGHGARDDNDEKFYLVPQNVGRDLERTCVPGDVVKDRLAAMPGKLLMIMDACHSGAVADSFKAGRADGLVRELVSDDYGVIVMCSSQGSEFSLESPEVRGGFFTAGLVEGLEGRADLNKDREVWIHELDTYAAARTRQLSDGEQNSVTARPPSIRPFPLTRP